MNAAIASFRGKLKAAPVWQWALVGLVLVVALGWWLLLPAQNSSIGISARTGALTVEALCGEQLVWDLPAGRVTRRGADPGIDSSLSGRVTLVLNAGSRAILASASSGVTTIAVERAKDIEKMCGVGSTVPFEAVVDGETVEQDPEGFMYAASVSKADDKARSFSLPLSGHVLLGQVVQQGAGWDSATGGMLQAGALSLRVVPAFSDERVTLSTEQVDEGSLVDSHGCLEGKESDSAPCLSSTTAPARGFVKVLPAGGLSTQLYTRGPVGIQPYGGDQQHLLTIPNSTAAWRSDVLKVSVGALLTLFALFKYVADFRKFVVDPGESEEQRLARERLEKMIQAISRPSAPVDPDDTGISDTGDMQDAEPSDCSSDQREGKPNDSSTDTRASAGVQRAAFAVIGMIPVLGALTLYFATFPAFSEPVELRQDAYTGAGFSFHRGTACLVLTARHVVAEIGLPIVVLDRTGAKAEASRTYENESYDVALVTLRESPPVIACTTAWPQTAWLRGMTFSPASDFQVLRHYPSGKEVIVRLKYAGGAKDRLSLAPADKLTIRESDSGSIVMFDGKPVGIVQSIDTATDRINVLRFDVIEQLVGDRFRSAAALAPVQVDGVFQRGRQNTNWSAFLRAWVTETTGRQAISQQDHTSNCKLAVDVIEWRNVQIPNPAYEKANQQDCSLMKLLGKQLLTRCEEQKRNAIRSAPRTLVGYTMALEVKLTPRVGAPVTKLANGTAAAEAGQRVRTADSEFNAMETIMAPAVKEMFDSGACD